MYDGIWRYVISMRMSVRPYLCLSMVACAGEHSLTDNHYLEITIPLLLLTSCLQGRL